MVSKVGKKSKRSQQVGFKVLGSARRARRVGGALSVCLNVTRCSKRD